MLERGYAIAVYLIYCVANIGYDPGNSKREMVLWYDPASDRRHYRGACALPGCAFPVTQASTVSPNASGMYRSTGTPISSTVLTGKGSK